MTEKNELVYITVFCTNVFYNYRLLSQSLTEGLPGVLGNKRTLAKYRREQRNISQFLGTREQNSKNYNTKKF